MLHNDYGFQPFKMKNGAELAAGEIKGIKCLLVKPMQYMNRSGISTAAIANFYKIPLDDIFVIHDELDVPFQRVKVKTGGSAGGHNGLRSLDQNIGKEYHRIRIGIDHPGHKDAVTGHVLGNFSKTEIEDLPYILGPLSDELPALLKGHKAEFLNKIALRLQTNFQS